MRKPTASTDQPKRSNRLRPVAELVPDVGRVAFRKFGFVQSAVVRRWSEIVGERYAGVSAPESIRFPRGERSNGVLSLVVQGAHARKRGERAARVVGAPHQRGARGRRCTRCRCGRGRGGPRGLRPTRPYGRCRRQLS